MLKLLIELENKSKQEYSFDNRADAQSKINSMYWRRQISLKEWNRLWTILSEPNIND